MVKTANPTKNIGFRPQVSALVPTTYATGTITTCAATMHADISAVPTSLLCKANSWPTSGSMAALAKWNVKTTTAKIINLRLRSSTANPDGCLRCSPVALSIPRATSLSIASPGTLSVATTLITAMPANSQNTTTGPKK